MLSLLACSLAIADDSNGVPRELLSRLTNGVNVTRWFCYLPDKVSEDRARDYFVDEDWAALKRLDVKFFRLCIAPTYVVRDGKIDPKAEAAIRNQISVMMRRGLAVIWDFHDNGQSKFDAPGQDNGWFVEMWRELTRIYKGQAYGKLVFELANEPVFRQNPEVWYALQEKTVRAIREIDPKRTILVTGTDWGGIDSLAKMTPLAAKNLIYSFHCYDPFMFTHQGATWTGDQQKETRHLPYPSSPDAVARILAENPERHRGAIQWYGAQKYDYAYLRSRVAKSVDWGHAHHVPTLLGEFGAYPPVSPPESRRRWFTDMRRVVDELKVPYAIWGYDDGLGLGRSEAKGKIKLDADVLKAFYRK